MNQYRYVAFFDAQLCGWVESLEKEELGNFNKTNDDALDIYMNWLLKNGWKIVSMSSRAMMGKQIMELVLIGESTKDPLISHGDIEECLEQHQSSIDQLLKDRRRHWSRWQPSQHMTGLPWRLLSALKRGIARLSLGSH